MLANRFYIGYIPDGNGGWQKAKHGPFIEPEIFEEAQKMRARRTTRRATVRSDANVYSMSGIARCAECGSTMRTFKGRGRLRLVCNGRIKRGDCTQPSTFLEIYEQQLVAYLRAFNVPDDYQEKILEAHRQLESAYDAEKQRAALESRLGKVKELYEWGHKTKEEYLSDYATIKRELQQLVPVASRADALEKLASFLKDVTLAWEQASQEHRNRLAGCLFEAVWIKDKKVAAVTPRPEFKPFFDLQYEGLSHGVLQMRPRGDLNSYLQYTGQGLFPVIHFKPLKTNHRLPTSIWAELIIQHREKSLREIGENYGVSYETVQEQSAWLKIIANLGTMFAQDIFL